MSPQFQEIIKLAKELAALGVATQRSALGQIISDDEGRRLLLVSAGARTDPQTVEIRIRAEVKETGDVALLEPEDELPAGWEEDWFIGPLKNFIRSGLQSNGAHHTNLKSRAHHLNISYSGS